MSSPSKSVATSRARPTIESRSTRFIVGVASSTCSRTGSTSASGVPGLDPVREHHDPGVIGAEPDLVLGQDHPARELAAERPLIERCREARQEDAGKPDCNRRTDTEVPGATDDLTRLALPHVDLAELELVGVRMLVSDDDLADPQEREVVARVLDADVDHTLDLERRDVEPPRDLVRRRIDGHVLAQPGERRAHLVLLQVMLPRSWRARGKPG